MFLRKNPIPTSLSVEFSIKILFKKKLFQTYNYVRQDSVEALKEHLASLNEDVTSEANDYLRNAKIPPNRSTFLHVSAANDARKCLKVSFLLMPKGGKNYTFRVFFSISWKKSIAIPAQKMEQAFHRTRHQQILMLNQFLLIIASKMRLLEIGHERIFLNRKRR